MEGMTRALCGSWGVKGQPHTRLQRMLLFSLLLFASEFGHLYKQGYAREKEGSEISSPFPPSFPQAETIIASSPPDPV